MDQGYLEELARLADDAPTAEGLAKLSQHGRRLLEVESRIIDAEEELRALKSERNDITMRQMPEVFDEVGTDHIGIPGAGVDLVLQPYYSASLPRDDLERQEAGFRWLEENGHGDLIKATVTIEFTRSEIEKARELAEKVQDLLGDERSVGIVTSVHWQTLTAFVREQIEKYNAVLPLDVLGATVGRVVKIKKRKN
jgi:hypothetical protein